MSAYTDRSACRAAAQAAYVARVQAVALHQSQDATARDGLVAIVAEWERLSYSDRHIDLHVAGRRGERAYYRALGALAAPPAIVAALDDPVPVAPPVPVQRGSYADHRSQFPELYAIPRGDLTITEIMARCPHPTRR